VALAAASARAPADAPLACRSVAGVPLRITAADAALAARLSAWLARGLSLGSAPLDGAPIWIHLADETAPPESPAGARVLADAPRCRVLRAADRVVLQLPQARCALDLAGGRARLWLAEDWWHAPLKTQQDPWVLALAWLLRERGRYALHASAVARNGRGLLITGASGSGNSSTALSLIQQGWDWLADDIVLFELGPLARLHGLARGFTFHPALAERLPGLGGETLGDKDFADIEGLFPGRQIDHCRPMALLFPEVTGETASRLLGLSPGVRIEVASPWEVVCEDGASLSPGPNGRWGSAGKEPEGRLDSGPPTGAARPRGLERGDEIDKLFGTTEGQHRGQDAAPPQRQRTRVGARDRHPPRYPLRLAQPGAVPGCGGRRRDTLLGELEQRGEVLRGGGNGQPQ
jgi:hypothetical protein